MPPQSDSIGFMSLPPELRNRIYNLVLVQNGTISVHLPKPDISRLEKVVKQPALLKVCKTVREEALPVFYGANRFTVNHLFYREVPRELEVVERWLGAIGPEKRAMLRQFDAYLWRHGTAPTFDKIFPSIRGVQTEIISHQPPDPDQWPVLRFYDHYALRISFQVSKSSKDGPKKVKTKTKTKHWKSLDEQEERKLLPAITFKPAEAKPSRS